MIKNVQKNDVNVEFSEKEVIICLLTIFHVEIKYVHLQI